MLTTLKVTLFIELDMTQHSLEFLPRELGRLIEDDYHSLGYEAVVNKVTVVAEGS